MQVKKFIIAFGIEKLQGKSIEHNGETFNIVLRADALEYHSLKNEDWKNSKERLESYHTKGNYRFHAVDKNDFSVWIYPTTNLVIGGMTEKQAKFKARQWAKKSVRNYFNSELKENFNCEHGSSIIKKELFHALKIYVPHWDCVEGTWCVMLLHGKTIIEY